MSHQAIRHPGQYVLAAALLAVMGAAAQAQNTTIGVNQPAPVVPQQGLLATYYSFPVNSPTNLPSAGGNGPGSVPTSPMTVPPTQGGTVLLGQQIDPPLASMTTFKWDYVANKPPLNIVGGVPNSDWFMTVWEGRLVVPTTGTYIFYVGTDDGERLWITNVTSTTPTLDHWVQRGVPNPFDTSAGIALTMGTVPMRFEFEQGNGGASVELDWSGPPGTQTAIPRANFLPPAGPNAVTPNVVPVVNNPTPAINIDWPDSTTPVAATSWILSRATAVGGPFTQIAVQTTRTFADAPPAFGTYWYIVQATAANGLIVGDPAAPVSGTSTQPPVSVSPAGPIVTSEAGLNATLTLRVNVQPTADANVQITSSKPLEANFTAPGVLQGSPINVLIPNGTPVGTTIAVVVHGLDDAVADGPQAYTVSFVVTGGGAPWAGAGINPVNGTNNDNDTPGISVTPVSSPTTESGGTATIVVTFNTAPTVSTTISAVSSNTAEAVVTSIVPNTFTALNYSSPHVITLTGVDDTLLDFTQPYTITISVTGGDPVYTAMAPISVAGTNLDNEAIPELPHVWGKGGCGLTGLEGILVLALGAAWRRRRRTCR